MDNLIPRLKRIQNEAVERFDQFVADMLGDIITELENEKARPTRSWEPADSARARATSNAQLIDVDLHIDRYIVRCRERGNSPSNAEWLRWFMDDEQAARIQARRDNQDGGLDNTGVPSTWH